VTRVCPELLFGVQTAKQSLKILNCQVLPELSLMTVMGRDVVTSLVYWFMMVPNEANVDKIRLHPMHAPCGS
jgi:uncharacterized protein YbbK (DUF523 family)